MVKWQHRDEGKRISKSVIEGKTTTELRDTQKFLKTLLALRKSQKLEKTYINGTLKAIDYNQTDKVFVDYRFDGTTSGRLSCAMYSAEKPMGVSFHTLPRDTKNNIRSMFVPPKDNAFITVDYSTMELRVLAILSCDENMIRAFKSGEDLHSYTGSLLFDKRIEEVTTAERQIAKTVSFLVVYGGGAFNLAETTGVSMAKANKVVDTYRAVYPGVFQFMDFIHEFIRENKYAYTIFGRRRNLMDIDSKDKSTQHRALRQGFNFVIQSMASDILLFSLLGIAKTFEEGMMGSRVVSTVHDSLEVVSPYDEVEASLVIIYNHMINYPKIRESFGLDFGIPFAIESMVGHSFGDGIEAYYDESGSVTNMDSVTDYLGI